MSAIEPNPVTDKKLYIETYGCQMNAADSEVVASVMQMAGYSLTDSIEDADAVLLNTCSIRDNAEQKIVSRLEALNAMRRKRSRSHRLLTGVIGCMAERVRDTLINDYNVDIVAGPDSYLDPLLCLLPPKADKKPSMWTFRPLKLTATSYRCASAPTVSAAL